MQSLDVVGVRMEMPSNNPIVLLRETGGERYLPIWVGAVVLAALGYAIAPAIVSKKIPNVPSEGVISVSMAFKPLSTFSSSVNAVASFPDMLVICFL